MRNDQSVMIVADLHISPGIWVNRRSIRGDAELACTEIVKAAKENGNVGAVIFAGDTFDKNMLPDDCLVLLKKLVKELQAIGIIDLYFITGQHDSQRVAVFQQLFDMKPLMYEVLGNHAFAGINHTYKREEWLGQLEAVKGSGKKVDYLIVHEPFKELLGFEGAYVAELDDCAGMPIKAVFAGDVHVLCEQPATTTLPAFYSTGSMFPQSSAETAGPRKVFFIDSAGSITGSFIASRMFHEVNKSLMPEWAVYLVQLNQRSAGLALPPVVTVIRKVEELPLEAETYTNIIMVDATEGSSFELSSTAADAGAGMTLAKALDIAIDAKEQPALHTFMTMLLDAADPRAYIGSYLKDENIPVMEK